MSTILFEIGDVLSRARIAVPRDSIIPYIDLIAAASIILDNVQGVVMGCRDPRDDKVMEAAMNGGADFIVSRDKDLLDASPREKYALEKVGVGIRREPIRIVSVTAFARDILDGIGPLARNGSRSASSRPAGVKAREMPR